VAGIITVTVTGTRTKGMSMMTRTPSRSAPGRSCLKYLRTACRRISGSATGCPILFVGFITNMAESDFSRPLIIGFGSSPSRRGPDDTRTSGQP